MDRPEHPDFWLIAEAIADVDTAAEDGLDAERVITALVDVESLMYAANQRALRSLPLVARGTDIETVIQAVWLDAFMIGTLYRKYKAERKDSEL